MIEPGLYHLLFISAALFFTGVFGFFTRRNLITMLMSVELVLNSDQVSPCKETKIGRAHV